MTTTTEAATGAPASPPTGGALAGRREWIGLAVLALACLLYVMDLTVLHLAVPSISRDLRPAAPSCSGSSISTGSWWPGS